MFAKPFIAQLGNGHVDGVYSFAKFVLVLSVIARNVTDMESAIYQGSQ